MSVIRPIEEAPKDGELILLYSPSLLHPVLGKWRKESFDKLYPEGWCVNRNRIKDGKEELVFDKFAYVPKR